MATRIIPELVVSAQLMDILECPICLRVPQKSTQIFQCANGHLFCAECYKSLQICSICRIPFHMHIRCIMAEKAISILNSAEQSFESNNNEPTQKIQQPQLRQQQQQHGYGYNARVFQSPPQQQRGHNATVSAHSLPRGPSAGLVPAVTGIRFPGPPQLYLPSGPIRGSIGLVPAMTHQRPPNAQVEVKKGKIIVKCPYLHK